MRSRVWEDLEVVLNEGLGEWVVKCFGIFLAFFFFEFFVYIFLEVIV